MEQVVFRLLELLDAGISFDKKKFRPHIILIRKVDCKRINVCRRRNYSRRE